MSVQDSDSDSWSDPGDDEPNFESSGDLDRTWEAELASLHILLHLNLQTFDHLYLNSMMVDLEEEGESIFSLDSYDDMAAMQDQNVDGLEDIRSQMEHLFSTPPSAESCSSSDEEVDDALFMDYLDEVGVAVWQREL